ncbi:hypothetical protein C8J57DRAFT_1077808 [Mycena rebaudengoi]|nr:hypothetical protein C8J57DRAFT_1077808 [Mycena rebaudengoi]
MARDVNGKDYYVEEPCLAYLNNGRVGPVLPIRWFMRGETLIAIVHLLHVTPQLDAFIIDGRASGCIELPLSAFFLSVVDLQDPACQARYGLPSPHKIVGIQRDLHAPLEAWSQPSVNPWRIKAKGRRVHSVPLWPYCDDTSGNVSKKWNKHNSILFTLAGLPRSYTQMLYNVHYITTSNIAPPLEIMEAVAAMLRRVYDCVFNEMVLVIPWFLAFQGDNPMSSEIASHIGMKGRYFCRVCKAKSDKKGRPPGHAGEIDRLRDFMTVRSSQFYRIPADHRS